VKHPKILLVDDVEFFLEMEKDFLRQTPATVLTARNGKEAFEAITQHRPDVVFMDVTMPVMDGISCCRKIKQDPVLRSTPVVMVFAPSREVGQEAVAAAGCDGILTKPVERKAFLDMGRRFLFDIERREQRIPCQMLVTLRRQGEVMQCTTVDVSERGIYVKLKELLAEGEVLGATLLLPGAGEGVLECRARVVWLNQGFPRPKLHLPQGAGLEFLHPGQALTATIRRVIEQERRVRSGP